MHGSLQVVHSYWFSPEERQTQDHPAEGAGKRRSTAAQHHQGFSARPTELRLPACKIYPQRYSDPA